MYTANITSGPAITQLSTVVVNTTGNPNSLHAIWSLTNNSNGSSPSFNASCTAQDGSHHVDYSVGQTYNATFVGLRPSTSYTCCVWAVVAGNAGSATCAVQTQTQGNLSITKYGIIAQYCGNIVYIILVSVLIVSTKRDLTYTL